MAEKKEEQKSNKTLQFCLILNENTVCGKTIGIRSINRESTNSLEFLTTCRSCVQLIKDDLASKSRIASAVYDGRLYEGGAGVFDTPDEKFNETIKEGECIFRFVVYKGNKLVFAEEWDGCVYPEIVRKHIDIVNDVTKFDDEDGNLSFKSWLYREMSVGKPNLVNEITNRLIEVSRPENVEFDEDGKIVSRTGNYSSIDDYTLEDDYCTVVDGKVVDTVTYGFGQFERERELGDKIREWEKELNNKKLSYFEYKDIMEWRKNHPNTGKNRKNFIR